MGSESPMTPSATSAMGDNAELMRITVKHILSALTQKTSHPYILVGGSSLLLHGSQRTTNDIDLLVPQDTEIEFSALLKVILEEDNQKWIEKADILTTMVGRVDSDFNNIKCFAVDIVGVKVPDLDVMLGSKVLSHHLRPDGIRGDSKRTSDLADIN